MKKKHKPQNHARKYSLHRPSYGRIVFPVQSSPGTCTRCSLLGQRKLAFLQVHDPPTRQAGEVHRTPCWESTRILEFNVSKLGLETKTTNLVEWSWLDQPVDIFRCNSCARHTPFFKLKNVCFAYQSANRPTLRLFLHRFSIQNCWICWKRFT